MKRTIITVTAVAAFLVLPAGPTDSQERLENRRAKAPQLVEVQMPGPKPVITSISPVGPDGLAFLRPGSSFVVSGQNFVPGKTTIGIRTSVRGQVAIPPQQHEYITSLKPTQVTPNRLDAPAPGGIAQGSYLLWVYVEGAGHSQPVPIQYSPHPVAPAKQPRITSVNPRVPGMKTTISGVNLGPVTMVQWPTGLMEVGEHIGPTDLRSRVPQGLTPGTHQVRVQVNGLWSDSHSFTVLDPKPLNLYWDETDLNGIPLNPRLGWQLARNYGAPDYYPDIGTLAPKPSGFGGGGWYPWKNFTDQPLDSDYGNWGCGPHVNWKIPVTFEGYWRWSSKSPAEPFGDDDYNFYFFGPDGAGATDRPSNRGGIMTEFDVDETVNHFHTSWWEEFHDAVDHDKPKAHMMVDRKWGIASAVWGLDCAHDCWSELHPVWVMAVHVKDDVADDRWSIFARNWGNQGYCGTSQHTIDLPKLGDKHIYRLRIPWRPGATSVSWDHEFLQRGDVGLSIVERPGERVEVWFSFHERPDMLPPLGDLTQLRHFIARCKPRINGQLRLHWVYPPGQQPQPYDHQSQTAWENVQKASGFKVSEEWEIYNKASSQMTKEQKDAFDAQMAGAVNPQSLVPDSVVPGTFSPGPTAHLPSVVLPLPQIQAIPDQDKLQRLQAAEQAVRALGSQVTVLPPTAPGTAQPKIPTMTARPAGTALVPSGRPDVSSLRVQVQEIQPKPPQISFEHNVDRTGGDYRNYELTEPRPELCRDACQNEGRCRAYTYVKPGIQGSKARCYLKQTVPPPNPNPCCVSGAKP